MNFAGADLSKLDLRFINFKMANMAGVNLSLANLSHCSLERANLSRAWMDGANLQGVRMVLANLEGASLRNCNFEDPSGNKANLEGKLSLISSLFHVFHAKFALRNELIMHGASLISLIIIINHSSVYGTLAWYSYIYRKSLPVFLKGTAVITRIHVSSKPKKKSLISQTFHFMSSTKLLCLN